MNLSNRYLTGLPMLKAAIAIVALLVSVQGTSQEAKSGSAGDKGSEPPPPPPRVLGGAPTKAGGAAPGQTANRPSGMQISPAPSGTLGTMPQPGKPPIGTPPPPGKAPLGDKVKADSLPK